MDKEYFAIRVSIPQITFLAQCMEQFPSLALASFGKSREETSCAHKKWLQIGSALNKIKPGVTKTGLGWLRYWTNYKYLLKKRYPQFKQSWVSNEPARVTPLERRFLQLLAEHETNQPTHVMFQSEVNADGYQTADEEAKDIDSTNHPEVTSESMPVNQEISQSKETKQELSHSKGMKQELSHYKGTKQELSNYKGTKQELSHYKGTKQELSQSMPTMQVVDVNMERKLESPSDLDDDEQDVDSSTEDPIGTEKECKEEIQIEILKFNLKRQREMHQLEMAQMKERHILEMEILELKKKKLMQDCDRLKNVYKLINN